MSENRLKEKTPPPCVCCLLVRTGTCEVLQVVKKTQYKNIHMRQNEAEFVKKNGDHISIAFCHSFHIFISEMCHKC